MSLFSALMSLLISASCAISGNEDKGVYLSGEDGQCDGNTISDCTISDNGSYGLRPLGDNGGQCTGNRIVGNQVSRNTIWGITLYEANGNRVENNNVSDTVGEGERNGIRTSATEGNLILKNSCVGNGTNYELDSRDTYGPIVEAAGELGTADGASHPWANFSR